MRDHLKNNYRVYCLAFILFLQLAIFFPHVGTGFITDDFIWLDNVIDEGKLDLGKPFTVTTGFYRPLVSLSFGLQFLFHGIESAPYGQLNLLLHLFNIIMVYLILNSFGPLKPYALLVAFLFAMNIKVNTMAVGWISGRTTLLYSCFSLLTFYLYKKWYQTSNLHKSRFLKIFFFFLFEIMYLAALLSKESALIIPGGVLVFFVFIKDNLSRKPGLFVSALKWQKMVTAFKSILIFIPPLLIYFILRLNSNAFTPFNAPDCYRFKMTLLVLIRNTWEYFTRAGLLDFIMVIGLLVLVVRRGKLKNPFEKSDLHLIAIGGLYFLFFLIPVLFLPVRSNIYVYFPQIGFHIAFAVLIVSLWRYWEFDKKKKKVKAIIFLLIIILLGSWSVFYLKKAVSYGKSGQCSTHFIQQVADVVPRLKNKSHLVIIDLSQSDYFSPATTVSYGLNFALKFFYFYPYKQLSGEIVFPEVLDRKNILNRRFVFFLWADSRLIGPFKSMELVRLFAFSLPPIINFPEIKPKQGKTTGKKISRLQKHRLGIQELRRLKKKIKSSNQTRN
ncbi:MAG: hypothetical protein KAT17_06075 [Candidatus Aminicenantes bacterium]|nr:hypothetical protein [Candidatus Aminicenantes bacterium]